MSWDLWLAGPAAAPDIWRVLLVLTLVTACAADSTESDPPITSEATTTGPTPSTSATSTTTSTTTTTTTTTATTTTFPEPAFSASISDVTEERLAHSWTAGCPAALEDLVWIDLVHWGFDGELHPGSIVVARSEGENVVAIFSRLFEIGYPIESVIPIGDLPVGIEDDDPDYNNTSGLHCRRATGSSRWSEHAKGLAIDINPFQNPFITSNILWPANSGRYLDRTLGEPAMIVAGDDVVAAFEGHGWLWGGYWTSIKDYQHFSVSGR